MRLRLRQGSVPLFVELLFNDVGGLLLGRGVADVWSSLIGPRAGVASSPGSAATVGR